MSRWLALPETAEAGTDASPDNRTKGDKSPEMQPPAAFCRVLSGCRVALEYFEERAAIAGFDGGLSHADAEQLAAEG